MVRSTVPCPMLKSACSYKRDICARQTSSGGPALPSGNRPRAYFRHRLPHLQRLRPSKRPRTSLPKHRDHARRVNHLSPGPSRDLRKLHPVRHRHGPPPQLISPTIRLLRELDAIQVTDPAPPYPTGHFRMPILEDKRHPNLQVRMSRRPRMKKNTSKTKHHLHVDAPVGRSLLLQSLY